MIPFFNPMVVAWNLFLNSLPVLEFVADWERFLTTLTVAEHPLGLE